MLQFSHSPSGKKQNMADTFRVELPGDCWEVVFRFLDGKPVCLQNLSLVSKEFLAITNRVRSTLGLSSLIVQDFSGIFERFRFVNRIVVKEFNDDPEDVFLRVAESGLNLEILDISRQMGCFPRNSLRAIGSAMRNLRSLICSWVPFLMNDDLRAIGESFPNLNNLDISYPGLCAGTTRNISGVTDDGIIAMSSMLGSLQRVNISGNDDITDKSILALTTDCVLLTELFLQDCKRITRKGIRKVLCLNPNLISLCVSDLFIPPFRSLFLTPFLCLKALSTLSMKNTVISDRFLYSMADRSFPLKKLFLPKCRGYSFSGISYLLKKNQSIEMLSLAHANFFTDACAVRLSELLPCLSLIDLSYCDNLTSITFFALARNCRLLTDIIMENTHVHSEPDSTSDLFSCEIKHLNLSGTICNIFLGKMITSICPNLERLRLNRFFWFQRERNNLKLPELQELDLSCSDLEDEELGMIGENSPSLLHLDLTKCSRVTGAGVMKIVKKCSELRTISVAFCDKVDYSMVAWMVESSLSLKTIISPCTLRPNRSQQVAFGRVNGCLVLRTWRALSMAESFDGGLPEDCWELVFGFLTRKCFYLDSLSLVSQRFLAITNRIRFSLRLSDLTVPVIPLVFRRFRFVKQINVQDFHGDLDDLLLAVAESGLDLESLDLSGQKCFPLKGFRALESTMKNLRKLKCSLDLTLRDEDLIVIAESFPNLEDLDISHPINYSSRYFSHSPDPSEVAVTDAGIMALSSSLRQLQKLNISGHGFLTNHSILALSTNCVFLREIIVKDCALINEKATDYLSFAPNLRLIDIDCVDIRSHQSRFISSLLGWKSLSSLSLANSTISDELLYTLAKAFLPLKKLVLNCCSGYTFNGISFFLLNNQRLEWLTLKNAAFLTDSSMIELSEHLPNVTSIDISSNNLTGITFFALAKNCPRLNEIIMKSTKLGREEETDCTSVLVNPRVKSLNFSDHYNCLDLILKKIISICPNLEQLKLEKTYKGKMMNFLKDFKLSSLQVLELGSSQIEDLELATVGENCPFLLHLSLQNCFNVTGEGVKSVVENCGRLRAINLGYCRRVDYKVVPWMVFRRSSSLKRIVSPHNDLPTENQRRIYRRHGCLVYTSQSQHLQCDIC